jgi:hypothetical protein
MIDEKYYNIPKEKLTESDYWTNKLYNMAYERVKDRKYPLIIPSYNRPDNRMTKYIYEHTIDSEPWDIYVVVRASQKEAYENAEYFKKCNGKVKLLAFPDKDIDDLGKVRVEVVKYFTDKVDCVLMMDDDVNDIAYTAPYTRASGAKISVSITDKFVGKTMNFSRIMAMWQVAMEETIKIHDNVIISCPMIAGFSWAPDFCDPELSLKVMSGAQACCMCVNLNACKKYDINFRTNKGNGHEDKDFTIRAIQKGCMSAEFRWLAYYSDGLGTDFLNSGIAERMAKQHDEMYANFKDVDFVRWIIDRKGLKNVRINWSRATKYHNKLTGDDINKNNNRYNLAEILNL